MYMSCILHPNKDPGLADIDQCSYCSLQSLSRKHTMQSGGIGRCPGEYSTGIVRKSYGYRTGIGA